MQNEEYGAGIQFDRVFGKFSFCEVELQIRDSVGGTGNDDLKTLEGGC